MGNKLAMLFCLCTMFVVGSLVFIFNQTVDFPTIFLAFKVMIPAGAVAYICGYLIKKIFAFSHADTNVLNTNSQKQFVDDLLLTPEQVINTSVSNHNTSLDNETPEGTQKNDEGSD